MVTLRKARTQISVDSYKSSKKLGKHTKNKNGKENGNNDESLSSSESLSTSMSTARTDPTDPMSSYSSFQSDWTASNHEDAVEESGGSNSSSSNGSYNTSSSRKIGSRKNLYRYSLDVDADAISQIRFGKDKNKDEDALDENENDTAAGVRRGSILKKDERNSLEMVVRRSSSVKKNVSFATQVRIKKTIHISDVTDDERTSAWFSSDEFKEMRSKIDDILKAANRQHQHKKKWTITGGKKTNNNKKNKRRNSKNNNNEKDEKNNANAKAVQAPPLPLSGVDIDIDFESLYDDCEEDENLEMYGGESFRGIELETDVARKSRDEIAMRAKEVIMTAQRELIQHVQMMKRKHDQEMKAIRKKEKKERKLMQKQKQKQQNKKNNNSSNKSDDEEETAELRPKLNRKQTAMKDLFISQHNAMIKKMADNYTEICKKHAIDARRRGLIDERISRRLMMEEEEEEEQQCNSLRLSTINEGQKIKEGGRNGTGTTGSLGKGSSGGGGTIPAFRHTDSLTLKAKDNNNASSGKTWKISKKNMLSMLK